MNKKKITQEKNTFLALCFLSFLIPTIYLLEFFMTNKYNIPPVKSFFLLIFSACFAFLIIGGKKLEK